MDFDDCEIRDPKFFNSQISDSFAFGSGLKQKHSQFNLSQSEIGLELQRIEGPEEQVQSREVENKVLRVPFSDITNTEGQGSKTKSSLKISETKASTQAQSTKTTEEKKENLDP